MIMIFSIFFLMNMESWSQHLNAFSQVWGEVKPLCIPDNLSHHHHKRNKYMEINDPGPVMIWIPSRTDWRESIRNSKEDINRVNPKLSWRQKLSVSVFMFLCLWWNKHLGLTSKQCDGPALDKTFPSFNFLRPESFYSSFDFKVLGKDLLSLNSVMMPLMIIMKKLIRLMMMMIKMRASWPFYFPQRVAPKIGADSSAVGHSHTLAEI